MHFFLTIQHATFAPDRKVTLRKLLTALVEQDALPSSFAEMTDTELDGLERISFTAPQGSTILTVDIQRDPVGYGPWTPARRGIEAGIRAKADWILVANDDMLPGPFFLETVTNALTTRTLAHALGARNFDKEPPPVSFYANHQRAPELEPDGGWYTTDDGLVGVCYALHRSTAVEFLRWHDEALVEPLTNSDLPVNLWAMATRRRIWHTVPSLVDHQCPDTSLRGHEGHGHRRPEVLPRDARGVTWGGITPMAHFGRRYAGNHWSLFWRTKPDHWSVENVFNLERGGSLDPEPSLMIATPAYGDVDRKFLESRDKAVAYLQDRGIKVRTLLTEGDSLVTRARHSIMHLFLCSPSTHLLFWDSDLECLTPSAAYRMLMTKHELVGGAYPFRRPGPPRVVATLRETDIAAGEIRVDETECVPVQEVGTGFMMISRKLIRDLCEAHPELLYISDTGTLKNRPMWALFDTKIRDLRYLSEDYEFCRLATEAGTTPHVYVNAKFRHWGRQGFEGTVQEAWGLAKVQEEAKP